tara:strand:- start:41460 stop:41861 length:402 start_codon:yes stop_codon:yes gene_type:complete
MIVLDEFVAWAGAGLLAINLAVTVWNIVTSGSKKNGQKIDALEKSLNRTLNDQAAKADERLDKLETRTGSQDKRIALVEQEMRHLPTKDQVSDLRNSITQLEGTIKEIGASLNATAHTVSRIDTYLRKDDSKS